MTNPPSFRSIQPKMIPTEVLDDDAVTHGRLLDQHAIPYLVESSVPHLDLARWAARNTERIEALLSEHGALLFRGFCLDGASGFQRFARVAGGGPGLEYIQRSTRRKKVAEGVYTTTEYPAPLPIELHPENAFQYAWPQRVMFYSVDPAASGGATPVGDNAAVFEAIDPRVREEFVARGITYARNFGAGLELPWQEAFQTEQREDVEAYCHGQSILFEWKDGDRLWTQQVLPAVIRHPKLGMPVWHNQVHLFHVTNLAADIRAALLESVPEVDLPRHAYFGDGGVIPDEYMAEIRRAYDVCRVRFPWRREDVMLLDNLRMCHGREPFTGHRKVLVSMTSPADYGQFPYLPVADGATPATV